MGDSHVNSIASILSTCDTMGWFEPSAGVSSTEKTECAKKLTRKFHVQNRLPKYVQGEKMAIQENLIYSIRSKLLLDLVIGLAVISLLIKSC